MKIYRISSNQSGLSPGQYKCKGDYRSFPWILSVDNYDMSEEELIYWISNEIPYILEVYNAGY